MRIRPLAAVLLCLSLPLAAPVTATAGAGSPAAVHDRAERAERADAAGGWLARQLVDGERFEAEFGGEVFPDQGLTIDAILAFAATRSADADARRATAWLARPEILAGYVGDGAEAYAGATAKAALAAEVRGLNPATFGGVDLPGRLRGLVTASGRVSDRSAFGDFSNAFSQSLAVIALQRTPGRAPAAAVAFAVGTQCSDGGFPLDFGAATCVSDTDATALVVQALLATRRYADAREGLAWLAGRQQPNGGLAAGPGAASTPPNANTTGLAGQAFRAGGRLTDAAQARSFVLSLQQGCASPADLRGAIAFDQGGFDPATARRATPQAVLALDAPSLFRLTAAGSSSAAGTLPCRPGTA